jgi:hypothetical protein
LTEHDRDRAVEILAEERGLTGQPYFVVEHDKKGWKHWHVVWSRIDAENMRLIPDSFDAKICHAANSKIASELGLEKIVSPFDKDREGPRPPRAPQSWEMYRALKTGIDPRDITAEVTELFKQSQNGKEFQAALEAHGYELATGRRGLLILDSAGKEHSLAQRIEGVKTAELNAFMRDVDRTALPTVEQAKEQYQQRKIDALGADRATVRDEIQWEEALAQAAIAKEEKERRFIAPEDREHEKETRARADSVLGSAEREITERDNDRRDELRDFQRQRDGQRRIEQLDRLIFAALLEQAIRHPERLDEAQLLAWKMPTPFTIELNETIDAVQHAHGIEVFEIDRLILERERHADKLFLTEIDIAMPALAPVAFIGLQQRQEEHEREVALRDPIIFAGLLEHAICQPERLGQADSWRMPDHFTDRLTDTLTAIWEAQALNLDLSDIGKLITEREAQARALDRDQWKREGDELIAEGQRRQAAEQERQAAKPPRPNPAAPELGRIDAGIRLAYSLTGTGQEFADAIEDQGFILARMTEADAARLNKWETQRLKELKALEDALLLKERFRDMAEVVTGSHPEQQQQEAVAKKNPPQLTRTATWMAQTGGVDNLPPELLNQAQASYDKWTGPKEKYDLANYVDYVQIREAERREATPAPPDGKYKAGELVVVDQWGGLHQLNYRNTGDTLKDRENHLRDIDLAPLMSVTQAQSVAKEFHQHRQEERRQEWAAKGEEWLRQVAEKHWPINAPQPERQWAGLFEQAATEATRDERTESLHGPAAAVWQAFRQSGNEKHFEGERDDRELYSVRTGDREAFAAALDDKGIFFAMATKDEAERSRREAEFAKEIGNYAPRFKGGEIVIITEPRIEYHRDGEITEPRRVYKLDQSLAEKFVSALDNRSQLQGIDATLQTSDERAQLRREERTADRLERATSIFDHAPERARREKAPPVIGKAASRAIGGAFNLGEQLTGLVFSAFGASKSPEPQERDNREGERITDRSNAEAEYKIDVANYTAIRQQQEQAARQQQAARDPERDR